MDPMTLIVLAVTTAVTTTVSETVKQSYASLKKLLSDKFNGEPEAQKALSDVEQSPAQATPALKTAVTTTGADQDEAIIKAAQNVLATAQPEKAAQGKFNVTFNNKVLSANIGDNNTITQTFNETDMSG